jgi:uncharacterized protein
MRSMANPLNYVEIPGDVQVAKKFYSAVFGWSFKDWGPDYADTQPGIAFGINGDEKSRPRHPLPAVQVDDLEAARDRVLRAGGKVTLEIFAFPGGRRFHFQDASGNELACVSVK